MVLGIQYCINLFKYQGKLLESNLLQFTSQEGKQNT